MRPNIRLQLTGASGRRARSRSCDALERGIHGRSTVAGTVFLCDGVGLRSLSDIDLSTAANDPRSSASFSARKKSSTYSSEYASGFSGPAASHLAAPPSPRHEGNVEQAPQFLVLRRSGLLRCGWCWPTRRRGGRLASAIDFSAVPNFDDLDQSLVIVYGIDDAIITLSDAI